MGKTKNTSLDTVVTDFILLGLSHPPNLRSLLFLVFFIIYILTQLGNLLILLTVWADPKLHARPMYILLGVLSFLDMWLSSIIVPRIILNFAPASKAIPFDLSKFPFFACAWHEYFQALELENSGLLVFFFSCPSSSSCANTSNSVSSKL
ncbi:hypothetical protein H8959_016679 [Pygathrix nigripes]